MELLPSASRAAATYTANYTRLDEGGGLAIFLDCTAGTGTVTVTLQVRNHAGEYEDLLDSAGIVVGLAVTVANTDERRAFIAPGQVQALTGNSRLYANALPRHIRLVAVVAVGATTFSLGVVPIA